MRTQVPVHRYAVGEIVSLQLNEAYLSKLNPFTVEARMPPEGKFLQYRIKSDGETCRRVVSEHQLNVAEYHRLPPSVSIGESS